MTHFLPNKLMLGNTVLIYPNKKLYKNQLLLELDRL